MHDELLQVGKRRVLKTPSNMPSSRTSNGKILKARVKGEAIGEDAWQSRRRDITCFWLRKNSLALLLMHEFNKSMSRTHSGLEVVEKVSCTSVQSRLPKPNVASHGPDGMLIGGAKRSK